MPTRTLRSRPGSVGLALVGWLSAGCPAASDDDAAATDATPPTSGAPQTSGGDGTSSGAQCEAILTRAACESNGCGFIAAQRELAFVDGQCAEVTIDETSPDALGLCSAEAVAQYGAPGSLRHAATGTVLWFIGRPAGPLGDWLECLCNDEPACGCAPECQPQPPASTGGATGTGGASSTGG